MHELLFESRCLVFHTNILSTLCTLHYRNLISHALVQYHFQAEEHSIFVRPHGNAKKSESYVCTMPSTLEILDNVSTEQAPKLAVHTVSS